MHILFHVGRACDMFAGRGSIPPTRTQYHMRWMYAGALLGARVFVCGVHLRHWIVCRKMMPLWIVKFCTIEFSWDLYVSYVDVQGSIQTIIDGAYLACEASPSRRFHQAWRWI